VTKRIENILNKLRGCGRALGSTSAKLAAASELEGKLREEAIATAWACGANPPLARFRARGGAERGGQSGPSSGRFDLRIGLGDSLCGSFDPLTSAIARKLR